MPHITDQNYTKILLFKHKDYDPSIELILLYALRFLLHSDPDMHHNPITNISDLALIRYSIHSMMLCQMISFLFYSLRPSTIPWSKTIGSKNFWTNTMNQPWKCVRSTLLDEIPRAKTIGSKTVELIPWTNHESAWDQHFWMQYHGPKP